MYWALFYESQNFTLYIYIAFKPDSLTYTWVSFAILSNIPSGNEFKGLSKMVLKMKRVYTH